MLVVVGKIIINAVIFISFSVCSLDQMPMSRPDQVVVAADLDLMVVVLVFLSQIWMECGDRYV